MKHLNAAEQIREFLGIPCGSYYKTVNGEKMPHFTKKGPGRYHQQGKKSAA